MAKSAAIGAHLAYGSPAPIRVVAMDTLAQVARKNDAAVIVASITLLSDSEATIRNAAAKLLARNGGNDNCEAFRNPHSLDEDYRDAHLQAALARLDFAESAHCWALSLCTWRRPSLEELLAEKRSLRSELRQYDLDFAARHGRPPTNAEKEPLRVRYVHYKRLKHAIAAATKGQLQTKSCFTNGADVLSSLAATLNVLGTAHASSKGQRCASDELAFLEMRLHAVRNKYVSLQSVLRSFAVEFVQKNNRKIRFRQDIDPIQKEYRAYMNVKGEHSNMDSRLMTYRLICQRLYGMPCQTSQSHS